MSRVVRASPPDPGKGNKSVNADEFERVFRPPHVSAGPHTLDSPIRYEVWRTYALAGPDERVDLLLEPTADESGTLLTRVSRYAEDSGVVLSEAMPAMIGGLIAIRLTFQTFIEIVVPLTSWRDLIAVGKGLGPDEIVKQLDEGKTAETQGASAADRELFVASDLADRLRGNRQDLIDRFRWFTLLIARIGYLDGSGQSLSDFEVVPSGGAVSWLAAVFAKATEPRGPVDIEAVSFNRKASVAVQRSRNTIKADAAHRVFNLSCAELGWAVLDSGIDARHPAFRKLDEDGCPVERIAAKARTQSGIRYVNCTRIVETYDLTNARERFAVTNSDQLRSMRFEEVVLAQKIDLFGEDTYRPPGNDHGTHVAGILAANWINEDRSGIGQPALRTVMAGICPDMPVWDIRVLDDWGQGDEFSIVAGLRLVEAINRRAGRLKIHGVNLSVSIAHHVANYACGWTPICNACNALVDSGVIVVVAAGNTGFNDPMGTRRATPGVNDGNSYNTVSITDPGNADKVITVGATHATLPHQYGISYFSARGPTADGRRKPDILAPGEGITGPIPLVHDREPDFKSYDGTSQAAPHVSGAAALLMSRYPELRGQPIRVKEILCQSATDLAREPYFQGHGLVDVLRALQSY